VYSIPPMGNALYGIIHIGDRYKMIAKVSR
jgi:hypothetical protein